MEPQEVVQKALVKLKEHPELWGKGDIYRESESGSRMCVIGFLNDALGIAPRAMVYPNSPSAPTALKEAARLVADSTLHRRDSLAGPADILWRLNDRQGYDAVIEALERAVA